MAEQLLDRAQVGAALQQVGGEGVAQGVRMDAGGERRPVDVAVDQAAYRAHSEPPTAIVQKDRLAPVRGCPADALPDLQPSPQRRGRRLPERHHPFPAALAHHAQGPAFEVEILPVQVGQLTHPKTRGVEQLQKRQVPAL